MGCCDDEPEAKNCLKEREIGGHMKRFWMTALLLTGSLLVASKEAAAQNAFTLQSPDKRIQVSIRVGDRLRYDVIAKGKTLLQDSTMSLKVDQSVLGRSPRVKSSKESSYDQIVEPPVRQKFAKIREHYNELRLEMEMRYAVVFRAFNEGVAYRFETALPQEQVKIYAEEVAFSFVGNNETYFPVEEIFSHSERKYLPRFLTQIPARSIATLLAIVIANDGTKIAIAESDVEDYPGMWLRGT